MFITLYSLESLKPYIVTPFMLGNIHSACSHGREPPDVTSMRAAKISVVSSKFTNLHQFPTALDLYLKHRYIFIHNMDKTDSKVLEAASMYRAFRELMNLQQCNMDFELYAAKVSNLVDKLKLYDEETFLKYVIVNGAHSRRAFSQVLDLGPNATLQEITEIYRNDHAVELAVQVYYGRQFRNDR